MCHKKGVRIRLQTQSIGKGEKLLVIEDVPVIHCNNCGVSYLTAETLHQIETIRKDRTKLEKRPISIGHFTNA